MWPHFALSNQTTPTHQHNLQVEDSPSDPPELPEEETLEFQEEYPQEVAEEVEEAAEEEAEEEAFLLLYQPNRQLPMGETSLLAIHRSYLQGIAPNQKSS